jgi:hypothetical protein
MKTVATILVSLCSLASLGQGVSTRCTVVHRISGCDYFMVQTRSSYAILEWYGGHDPDKDDTLEGDLTGAGVKSLREVATDSIVRVYIEDKGLSKSDAMEKLVEHCE